MHFFALSSPQEPHLSIFSWIPDYHGPRITRIYLPSTLWTTSWQGGCYQLQQVAALQASILQRLTLNVHREDTHGPAMPPFEKERIADDSLYF